MLLCPVLSAMACRAAADSRPQRTRIGGSGIASGMPRCSNVSNAVKGRRWEDTGATRGCLGPPDVQLNPIAVERCAVCLDDLEGDVVSWPRCGHGLHRRCARDVMARSPPNNRVPCPSCRQPAGRRFATLLGISVGECFEREPSAGIEQEVPAPPGQVHVTCCVRRGPPPFFDNLGTAMADWAPLPCFEQIGDNRRLLQGWHCNWSCPGCGRTIDDGHGLMTGIFEGNSCPIHGPCTLLVDMTVGSAAWVCDTDCSAWPPLVIGAAQLAMEGYHNRGPPEQHSSATNSFLYCPLLLAGSGHMRPEIMILWEQALPWWGAVSAHMRSLGLVAPEVLVERYAELVQVVYGGDSRSDHPDADGAEDWAAVRHLRRRVRSLALGVHVTLSWVVAEIANSHGHVPPLAQDFMLTHVLGETASLRLLMVADIFRLRSVWTQLDPFGPDPPWEAMEAAPGSSLGLPCADSPLPQLLLQPPSLSAQSPATPTMCGQRTPMMPMGQQQCCFVWPPPEATPAGMQTPSPPLAARRSSCGSRTPAPAVPMTPHVPPAPAATPAAAALTALPAPPPLPALLTQLLTERTPHFPQCVSPVHAEWAPLPWRASAAPSLLLLPSRPGRSQGSGTRRCRSQPAHMARSLMSPMVPTSASLGSQVTVFQSPRGARPHQCHICRLPFAGGECRLHLTHQEPGNALWVCHVRCARDRMDRASDLGVGTQYRVSVLPPAWPLAQVQAPPHASVSELLDRLAGSRQLVRAAASDVGAAPVFYRQVQFGTRHFVSAPGRPDHLAFSPPCTREVCAGDVVCTAGLDIVL